MSVIRFGGFLGEIPRIHPRLLPEGNAQTALNTRLDSGALDAARGTSNLKATVLTNPISLYRYSASVWLESITDTDWVGYPIADDQFGRLIYADPTFDGLRVTDASLVGAGGAPASYWNLDVPAPAQGFSAALIGTADDEDEVPETRYYVCTFVNNYGAEGPPSPPSNEIEWRSGQTVDLAGLPAVPAGNYNITWRRIYRVNTGSTSATNYQFLTEIAIAQSQKTVASATQANPVVVTTTTAHGLSTGMEVEFSNFGLATATNINLAQKTNPVRVTSPSHGLQGGQTVAVDNIVGMTELNGTRGVINLIDADRFDIVGVDATAYTAYVSGGTAARVYGMDELDDGRYFISVGDDTTFSLTGIDGTGFEAYVELGQVTQIAGVSYTDAVPSANLGEVLPTELYDPANAATIGLREHPAGFLVGFFNNTLVFSEPGAPHAWPIDYRLVTNHDIIGLGIFGNAVAVTTEGWPYLAIGSDPAAMTMVELEIEQSCISKRGIVDLGTAIAYPSPDGLLLVSTNGAQNITSGIFTRDQWQALNPASIVAFNWEQQYLGFYDDGAIQRAFVIDPFGPEAGVRYIDKYATGGYKDIEEDLLYLIINNQIEIWDEGTSLQFTWKSKPVFTPRATNMSAAKVIADDYPVTVEFYVDDVKRYTRVVDSSTAFRLPGGFRGEEFELVIKGTRRVSEVIMATTMTELSVTV